MQLRGGLLGAQEAFGIACTSCRREEPQNLPLSKDKRIVLVDCIKVFLDCLHDSDLQGNRIIQVVTGFSVASEMVAFFA